MTPAPERWNEREHKGRLVRMTALGGEKPISTRYGQKWAVPAKVEILDGMWAGHVYRQVLIFPSEIRKQITQHGKYVGRVGTRTNAYGNPGWCLLSATKEEMRAANWCAA